MPTIFLIRHGESQANVGLPTSGPENVVLTAEGIAQAERIAFYLKSYVSLDLIITSPYLRTQQTATYTQLSFPSIPEEHWMVQEFTYLSLMHEGHSTIVDRRPFVDAYWEQCQPSFVDGPGSESFEQFIVRVQDTITKLKNSPHQCIALFSHEQFMCAILWLLKRSPIKISPQSMWDFRDFLRANTVRNGAIVRAQFLHDQDAWLYEWITEHLQ